MWIIPFIAFLLFLTAAAAMEGEQDVPPVEPSMLLETARVRSDIPGAPAESDVAMRFLRPRLGSGHNTLDAIREFHVTWLEWTYVNGATGTEANGDFIQSVKDSGAVFGAASAAGSYRGDEPTEVWNVRDLDGNLIFAPWMRTWDPPNPWGCANHPEFRKGHLRYFKGLIDAGVNLFQRDEPAQNRAAFGWGGCFCDHCMEGFNDWLRLHADPDVLGRYEAAELDAFDYRDHLKKRGAPTGDAFRDWEGDTLKDYFKKFQIDSTLEFHRWWRAELNEYAGRHVPVSCNNGVHCHDEIEQMFDYWIGELHHSRAHPEYLYNAMTAAIEYGTTQTTTMPLYHTDTVSDSWIRHVFICKIHMA